MTTATLSPEQSARLAVAWNEGSTIAQLQKLSGVSRPSVLAALQAQGVDPTKWRDRNRAIGKPLGPVSAHKGRSAAIVSAYQEGASLAGVASRFSISRSTARRVLVQAGISMRNRGRPVKQAKADF